LIEHARDVSPRAEGNLDLMRTNIAKIVGRDTDKMDEKNCRRAAIESLAESLVDGILTPIFFFVLAGLPGMLIFKVISTMDSMVGYKNERYNNFGWAGARLDDLCNFIPARLCWLSLVLLSFFIPRVSAKGAWRIGRRDQHYLPGFNSGWPEAAMAGALGCRLVGPIYQDGQLTTDLWLGNAEAPEGGSVEHQRLAETLVSATTVVWVVIGIAILWLRG
jgi:adenosylcobinamide-phosphate synthase